MKQPPVQQVATATQQPESEVHNEGHGIWTIAGDIHHVFTPTQALAFLAECEQEYTTWKPLDIAEANVRYDMAQYVNLRAPTVLTQQEQINEVMRDHCKYAAETLESGGETFTIYELL